MADSPKPIKGMSDLFSPEVEVWQTLESRARDVMARFDFHEVRTPIVEPVEVYMHSLGDSSEIVEKQMYAFETRGGKQVCLRPEGTAGVMRFVAGHLQEMQDARLYYTGPMFRAERPQAGRRRQFHQFGVEALGAPAPWLDAEVIALQADLFAAWELGEVSFQLNTRGRLEDFPAVLKGLREQLLPQREELCEECQRRLESNVLRILDCKHPVCGERVRSLPPITQWMSEESVAYFEEVRRALDTLGVAYTVNPLLVRGLDYYQHTIWEVTSDALGAQDAVSGGGRYQMQAGGAAIEGVGFGIGMERVVLALSDEVKNRFAEDTSPLISLVYLDDRSREDQFLRLQSLRSDGYRVRMDMSGRSLKAQMKAAGRQGARFTVVVGEAEVDGGLVQLKDMESGEQQALPAGELPAALAKALHPMGA
jgi:histidyl-tRNA synthetase